MRSETFSERRGPGFLRAGRSGTRSSWISWARVGTAIIERLGIADDQQHLDIAATAEFARVLKPGGRLCSSVWAGPEENPWTTIAMQAIATEAVLAPPDPDGPNMFRCAAPGYVSALYQTAGLRDVAEWNVDVELVTDSPAQYWEMISEHVSLAVAALQQVDEPARERIAKAIIAKVSTYEEDGRVRIPGLARALAAARVRPVGRAVS